MSAAPLRIGISGWGVVARSVFAHLQRQRQALARTAGRELQVVAIGSRSGSKGVDIGDIELVSDVSQVIDSDLDVVLELIGGTDTAFELVSQALTAGKCVVTANKALLAERGGELAFGGERLWYSAAVGGAVPMLEHLREGIAGDPVQRILGILNGTGNYLLTQLARDHSANMSDLVADAVRQGFAEADPSLDTDGIDAGHKLHLLARIAFGSQWGGAMQLESINYLQGCDFEHARRYGYAIKPVACAARGEAAWVAPCMIALQHPLASIHGSLNALSVDSLYAGTTTLTGRGAGGEPTAAAVVADLLRIARGTAAIPPPTSAGSESKPPSGRFKRYLRTHLRNEAGSLANLVSVLAGEGVSVDAVEQQSASAATSGRGRSQGVVTTFVVEAIDDDLAAGTVATINALPATTAQAFSMRVIDSEPGA